MVTSVGAKLVFLAPYSPIDNPIEQSFSVLKKYFERHADLLRQFPTPDAINLALGACYANPLSSASASYQNCGYF